MSPKNQTHTLTTPITSNPQQAVYMVDDPETKLIAYPHCKFCLISHMGGKLANMDAVKDACNRHCVTLLEDCTRSLAVFWNSVHTGHLGRVTAISDQN